ncbi:phospholipase D family protein [Haliangium sp.]|uniref:phospholipase D family protein n=1 Tax=Haliangium sp. TaxID=2663208 RepID=UPI003D0B618C
MKLTSARVLDRLPAEEPCLGALFTSYGFDPAFFEDHVLRAVLRLTSDPVEQAERYHHEARRALQETPVVAIVDAAERQPGRRLPFDLLEVSELVFHPKSVLLLYQKFARLMIGSGNLTFSGYSRNTELFLCVDLAYHEPADAALLRGFDDHLGRIRALTRTPGTQLDRFRDELTRRLPTPSPDPGRARLALLDSTAGPIIEQLVALLPASAVITSIGTLAPFYERDDASELDVSSVFGVLAPRAAKNASFDVGVAWDNPQMHASSDTELEHGLDRIWTWAYHDDDGVRVLEHLVPTAVGPNTLSYLDEGGRGRRWPLDEVRAAIEDRSLWMQPPPLAYAPRHAIAAAAERFSQVRLWLHPATRLVAGQPTHRPLHAKLLVVGYRAGRSVNTLVLMGSPNMSRRALLMAAGPGRGNVELAVAFRLGSSVTLRELVPELVHAPAATFELREREFPALGPNYALAVDEATHDPQAGTLHVSWSPQADDLPPWRLTYADRVLAESAAPPTAPITVSEFTLAPKSAEVILHVDGSEYPIPILVTDLVHLPAAPVGPSLGLEELLLLLGRRIGAERAIQLATQRAARASSDDRGELEAIFGEGFEPTDVFRAWWAIADELADPDLSVAGFRLRLEGALGAGAAWACMVAAVAADTMPVEQAWFYGAELLRTLGEVTLPPTVDRDAKRELMAGFCDRVRKQLGALGFQAGPIPWVERVLGFYQEAKP